MPFRWQRLWACGLDRLAGGGRLACSVRRLAGSIVRDRIARRRAWIVLAGFFVCSYALAVLGYVMTTPEIGARCAFTPVVNHFYPGFLYPEQQEPLREGDRIVQLGNQPVDNWSQLLRKLNQVRNEPAEPLEGATATRFLKRHEAPPGRDVVLVDGHKVVRVRYQRSGTIHDVWLRLGHSPLETIIPSILWFFLKSGLFVVGAIVFWKRPEDRSALLFFWFCIVSFGAYMGGYHWSRIVTQPLLIVVFMVCGMLLPAVSLHLYLVFPRAKDVLQRHPRWVLAVIYGPPVFFLLQVLSAYLKLRFLYRPGPDGVNSAAVRDLLREILVEIYFYFAVAALWYLASVVCLIHSYRTAANATERNQVKWILYGAVAAVAPIGYSLYLAFWEQGRFGGGAATWPMFAASVCVTAAYTISITRYRLMQLDQIVSSGFVYFLISFLAGLVYYGLVFAGMVLVGSQVGEGPSLMHVLGVSSTALVLMVALDLARGRFKTVLDRHFRREKHQLDRTLRRMSEAIEQLVDPPALARRLLHTSAEMLGAGRGAVYLRQGAPPLYCLADALGPAPALTELSSGCPLIEALRERGTLALPAPTIDPVARQLMFLGGKVAHGLQHEGQLLGLLLLGPKETGPYTAEDLNLLTAFTQIAVLALVSAEGHRTIDGLNRELQTKVEKIAEQQRRILSLQSQLSRMGNGEWGMGNEERVRATPSADRQASSHSPFPIPHSPLGMVGSGPQVHSLLHLVRKVAAGDSTVLLRGESGTGKELLARALHESSPRAARPFVTVHCTALSPSLLESELFGHVKGAFTSAIRDKIGRFEAAHGGTLFLDEIGDVSLEVQTKLLRVLQEKTFERVGSSEPMQVDVRILAATHQDLERLMRQGRFREDLFYRLNVFPITLPPLRDRAEDVPELVQHFLRLHAQRANKDVTGIDDDALALLKAHPWPGNIRQLENAIVRAVIVAEKSVVMVQDLPPELRTPSPMGNGECGMGSEEGGCLSFPIPHSAFPIEDGVASVAWQAERAERERREREQLVRALAAAGGNKAEAARALGMARSTLVSRLKRLGLS